LLGDITRRYQLKVMERAGLRRAVAAVPESTLRHIYNDISFAPGEENLPDRIADDLYAPDDNRSNAAPLLQFVLRKMWDVTGPRKSSGGVFMAVVRTPPPPLRSGIVANSTGNPPQQPQRRARERTGTRSAPGYGDARQYCRKTGGQPAGGSDTGICPKAG
jgi:hypothetical protein